VLNDSGDDLMPPSGSGKVLSQLQKDKTVAIPFNLKITLNFHEISENIDYFS